MVPPGTGGQRECVVTNIKAKTKFVVGKSFRKCDCKVTETGTTLFLDILVDKLMRDRKIIRQLSYFLLNCMEELLMFRKSKAMALRTWIGSIISWRNFHRKHIRAVFTS
jgi:hypothetical protein